MIELNNRAISWLCIGALLTAACSADKDGAGLTGPVMAAPIGGAGGQLSPVATAPVAPARGPSAGVMAIAPITAGTSAVPIAGRSTAPFGGSGAAPTTAGVGAAGSGIPGFPRGGSAGRGPLPMTGVSGTGAPAAPPVTNPANCPAGPADATPQALTALAAVNSVRIASGAGCVNLVNTISQGATNHCNYYAMYMSGDMCVADPHGEVMSCMGFTGASPGARSKAAGYTMGGGGEVMAFFNEPKAAVDIWVNSVWHRTPILDPSTYDLGYGAANRCDVIDFGRGMSAPATTLVVYPYDGMTGVPTNFNGANEGPTPPAPTTGWPSASPVSIHAKGLMITEHVITLDSDPTPIEHVWLDVNATIVAENMRRQLTNVNFMYANKPFAANTKYKVKLSGTYAGGMAFTKEWSFTTGAARRF